MGFMDKLKDAGTKDKLKDFGKSALKGALTMAAKSYGVVKSGKHKLCKVSMNNDKDKLVFIKVANVEAEYDIKESIKSFSIYCNEFDDDIYTVRLIFADGEESEISLGILLDKDKSLDVRYAAAADFVFALGIRITEISQDTKLYVNKILRCAKLPTLF